MIFCMVSEIRNHLPEVCAVYLREVHDADFGNPRIDL